MATHDFDMSYVIDVFSRNFKND